MGLREQYAAHLRERDAQFRETHLGAERTSGDTGRISYPYIAYHESGAAAFLELCSILSVIFGMGLMAVLLHNSDGILPYLIFLAGIVLVNRIFAVTARIVNNADVRRKISRDTEYARYFAMKYPAQARMCAELNDAYACNPDAELTLDTRMRQKADAQRDDKIKTIITAASLSFLGLMFLAMMAFCFWAMHENI